MLRARCRSICAMALRTICIGSRVSRQCSVTIRPSTRWILEDRRIVHPRDSSGQTQLMNSYWLPSNAQGSGRHGRNWFKCLESSKPGSLWVLCGISVLYTGPGRYRTDDKRAGWGSARGQGAEVSCFRKCGDGVVARLLGAPSWSKTRAGLIQAWFRTAPPSSTADSVLTRPNGYGETVACRSKGGFGTFAVRPA